MILLLNILKHYFYEKFIFIKNFKMENSNQMNLVIDEVTNVSESLQILYMLAQKANKSGILDLNESSQVHKALTFYTKLAQQLSSHVEQNEIQINS
jgi:flagellar motor component MotA